ncbi:MAG: hypothetical protein V5A45_12740 [Haloarculaceae archaeon]
MSDGTDAGDEEPAPFAEYGELDEQYQEPEEETLGPTIPEAPDLSSRDADPVVEGTFWTLVAVFNVGLLAVSLGVMFVIFQENPTLGWQLTVAGCLVLGYGFYRYRSAKEVIEERVGDGDDSGGTASDDGDDGSGDNHNE